MPSPILTTAARIMCPHGGQATPIPTNPTVRIAGSPVLVQTDIFPITGCVFNIAGAPAPCVMVQWPVAAVGVVINGVPALLASNAGLCMGGSPGVPAIVVPGQVQVLGT